MMRQVGCKKSCVQEDDSVRQNALIELASCITDLHDTIIEKIVHKQDVARAKFAIGLVKECCHEINEYEGVRH